MYIYNVPAIIVEYTLHFFNLFNLFSESSKATLLGLGVQIPEIPAQRKFFSSVYHAHFNAYKPPKTLAPTVLVQEYKL